MGKLILIVAVFIFVGGYMIYSSMEPTLDTNEGKKNFVVEFFKWLFQVGKSTKNTLWYSAQQDWLPDTQNLTNTTNSTGIIQGED